MNNQGAGVLALVCLLPALVLGFPALMILVTALVPTYFDRSRRLVSIHPLPSLLLGLTNFVFFLAIAAVFGDSALVPLKAMAVLSLFFVLPLMTVAGLATAAAVVGERVLALLTERPGTPLGTLIIGIICLGLSALFPLVGWLVLAILLIMGFGAALLALVRRNGAIPVATRPEAPTKGGASEASAE